MKSYKFIISGKVQGVYYRKTISENANKSKFNGYIKNLPNKNVEVLVTCPDNKLNEFIAILKRGSSYSKVVKIVRTSITQSFTNGFKVRY